MNKMIAMKVCGENYSTAPMGAVGVGLSPVRGALLDFGGPNLCSRAVAVLPARTTKCGCEGGTVGDAGKQMAAPSFRQHSLVQ